MLVVTVLQNPYIMQPNNENRDVKMTLSTVTCSNEKQTQLVRALLKVFKNNVFKKDLLKEQKEKVVPKVFVSKEV